MTDARDRIVRAAAAVVGEAGMHPWSMASVAQRAGLHRVTVYRYFPSKADLIEAIPEADLARNSDPRVVVTQRRDDGYALGRGRERLIRAARELFGQKGFEATSVREIAERAHISKVMIYRHFGTKANLFREATVGPYQDFLTSFLAQWSERVDDDTQLPVKVADFFDNLYEALLAQRELLVPLLWPASDGRGPNNIEYLRRASDQWFAVMGRAAEAESGDPNFRDLDPALVTRFILGMLLSIVLWDDWIFVDEHPSPDHIVTELVDFTLYGITSRARDLS